MDYYNQINSSNRDILFSIAQSGNVLKLPPNNKSEKINTLELSIENYLPIPVNCSFDKALEFKEKRSSELFAFRDRINELKITLEKENYSKDSLVRLKEKIHKNLLDIHKVMDENKFQKILSSMKTYLNLEDSKAINVLLPLVGEITGNKLELPSGYGGVAGLIVNVAINLGIKKQTKLEGLPKETQDFAYLYYMEKLEKKQLLSTKMYKSNYGRFDFVRIHSKLLPSVHNPKFSVYLPVTDGYTLAVSEKIYVLKKMKNNLVFDNF